MFLKMRGVRYITDNKGKCQEVVVPIELWKNIIELVKTVDAKQRLRDELKEACKEVKLLQAGTLPEETLEEFLDAL